jgi:Cu-Zn family superoxide dismutase
VGLALALWIPAHGFGADGFEGIQAAIAVLAPTAGNTARGTVRFTPHPDGVELTVRIEGLTQGTRHGFHVHEFGDCSAADAASAGPHYDPTHNAPGQHQHGMKPLGDLDDLRANAQGVVEVRFAARALSIAGTHPILGRALVLHAGFADPSDPMGDAGARIACGTIGVVAPTAAASTAP